jgi:hypothetical protein
VPQLAAPDASFVEGAVTRSATGWKNSVKEIVALPADGVGRSKTIQSLCALVPRRDVPCQRLRKDRIKRLVKQPTMAKLCRSLSR